jgi:hypothetical protein
MSEWDWQHAYPGGPLVPVAGMPRPLYPPDAAEHGKQPSTDGPDVVAYKRTVSRAGRWPWAAFDDTYSNGFAHGKPGGNVGDSGIAGIQRQQHLDATGWVGKTTFNTLRSIIIPDGLPHAGEMAMDATSVRLIDEAYRMFGGHEPDPDRDDAREAALALAATQIGYAETGDNLNKYGDWYGMNGQPWCAMFCTWAYETNPAGGAQAFVRGSRYAYVPYIVGDARAGRYGLHTTDDPIPGDLVCYDWGWDGEYDHVGLFETWKSSSEFSAIEGNTSTSSNSNGGQVMRRTRNRSGQGTVFVRVNLE